MFKKWLWKCWEYIVTLLKFCFGIAAVVLTSFGLAWLILHYFTIGVIAIGTLIILAIGLAAYLEIKYN